jgi:predicted RNA methylase
MKLRNLQSLLQDVSTFPTPKVELEQYPTSPELASQILFAAHSNYDDIQGSKIIDLGIGCGMLSIAAALLGAESITGIDIDPEAIATAKANIEQFDDLPVDLVLSDISTLETSKYTCDTVIMNPPFGCRTKGIDAVFLLAAFRIAAVSVYSLHKTSTRDFIVKKAAGLGWKAEVCAELRFDLPKTMRHHRKDSKDIEVDFIRFSRE